MKPDSDRWSTLIGIAATVLFHGGLVAVTVNSGLKYIYPPPQEKSIVLEFEPEEEIKPIEVEAGKEPRTPDPDVTKPVKLVQKSEAPVHKGTKLNEGKEATVGDKGDVEVPEPKREKEINQRALFSTANNNKKDTLAPQTADKASDALNSGHALGNTSKGSTDGQPSAKLEGRSVMGSLPLPADNIQAEGKVVVDIWVDREGNVVRATVGAHTISDYVLLQDAVKAAKKAKFNTSGSAPDLQQGTITYKYKLK